MTGALAIFVKTPGLSPVKTRLASDVGRLKAEAFYLASAEAVSSVAGVAGEAAGFSTHWAVAEPDALRSNAWKDLPGISQGQGSLGERMDSVYRQLRAEHGFAILVGADAPQLRVESLMLAAAWLDHPTPRLVIGRARDGGFWLFGGNLPLPLQAWLEPTYSQPGTAQAFIQAMSPHGQWLELDELSDVDRGQDLPTACRELSCVPEPTPAQQRLLEWIRDARLDGEALA